MITESQYQKKLIKRLKEQFPGCWVQKQPTNDVQGIPDLLILHNQRWAMLEVKRDAKSRSQPNQQYYIDKFNAMGFAHYINPDNEEEVFRALEQTFTS